MKKVEPEGTCQLPAANKALFLEKVRQSNAACQNGDFATSVALYTDALSLDPTNHILYSNRSAALVKMGRFEQALQDAIRAKELNSQWPKVRSLKNRLLDLPYTLRTEVKKRFLNFISGILQARCRFAVSRETR